MVPRAGVEPARPFSGKRRILSPQCLPISPSGRRLPNAHLHRSVTRAAHARNALSYLWSQGGCSSNRLPGATKKKGKPKLPLQIWSGKRVSNSRPQPWQGCALPTELFPHFLTAANVSINMNQQASNYIAIFWLCSIANQKINQSPSIVLRSPSMRQSWRIFKHRRHGPYLEARSGVEPD